MRPARAPFRMPAREPECTSGRLYGTVENGRADGWHDTEVRTKQAQALEDQHTCRLPGAPMQARLRATEPVTAQTVTQ